MNTYAYVRNNPMNRIDPLGLRDCVCGAKSERTEVKSRTLSSDEAIKRNEMNTAAKDKFGVVTGLIASIYGPAGRVASTATGLVAGYATGALTETPTLYGGFVEVTTVSYGSKGGYSVDYKMTDRSGKTVIEDSVEKCE
jgi:uncharacterized protein RhaS with RHS repeats